MMTTTMINNDFLPNLYTSLGHVRGFVASQVLFQLLGEGVFELISSGQSTGEIAEKKGYKPELFEAVCQYLVVEGVLEASSASGKQYSLTAYGQKLNESAGYLYLLVGGYDGVFRNLVKLMRGETGITLRAGKWIGLGSCNISKYDTIPLTRELIERHNPRANFILDYGCGNALYLTTLCRALPGVTAVGVEPNADAYAEGIAHVRTERMEDRVQLVNCDALHYKIERVPDFLLFGFVLHELTGQASPEEVVKFLEEIGRKFRQSRLIIMEVDNAINDATIMQTEMGRGYYNPYYLLHPFTGQRLLPARQWEQIFDAAGFTIVEQKSVDPGVDPSGLVLGYVLQHKQYEVSPTDHAQ